MINIQPVRVFPDEAVAIRFGDITLVPFTTAKTNWQLLDATGRLLVSGEVETTNEQYAGWGTDDNYITDCFLANLGLMRV